VQELANLQEPDSSFTTKPNKVDYDKASQYPVCLRNEGVGDNLEKQVSDDINCFVLVFVDDIKMAFHKSGHSAPRSEHN
jgi:hypothetical protein